MVLLSFLLSQERQKSVRLKLMRKTRSSTVKYVFLFEDIICNKAISKINSRDRPQESFLRVPKISDVSKIHNYHLFTTFLLH